MQSTRIDISLGDLNLVLETGKLAKQAHGAVTVQVGETVVLVAATEGSPIPGRDFFPLTCDYREKTYAAGKFPGGYIKREGRPSTKETLTSRLMDRPIRPMFPVNYFNEIQVMASTLSVDKENDPDVLAIIGASAALTLAPVPMMKTVGAVRVGRVDGQLVVMPTVSQLEVSDLDLIVAGSDEAICMIEGFAREMPEQEMGDAIMFAHEQIKLLIKGIESLRTAAGLPPKELPEPPADHPLIAELHEKYGAEFRTRYLTEGKLARYAALDELKDKIKAEYAPEGEAEPKYTAAEVSSALSVLRERIFQEITLSGTRIDGRQAKQVRSIECEVSVLPRTHGSAIFQRGETQALVIATLGTGQDEQRVEGLQEEFSKKFMLDYNFPPFSVGECKPIRGPGRREIGHGMLAERSLKAVLPPPNKFPYTIRLVSEILESNGSSSMASVCGGTLALMDAGVPIKDPVAGISVGLVTGKDSHILISDIQGDEDHYGDMDFKVAGTQRGVTGIQLDIKLHGITEQIMREALDQARESRREILKIMLSTLRAPRRSISDRAPRLLQVRINPEKIGLLIGPGGKNIRALQEETGAKLDIEDDGTVSIAHSDAAGAEEAKRRVEALCQEIKVGNVYEGKVSSIKEFGAFIEITPGRDGLCHISELDVGYVGRVEDVVRVGDKVTVKVIAIDDQDRVKLSRKVLLAPKEGLEGDMPPAGGSGSGERRPPREPRGEGRPDRGGEGRRDRGEGRGEGRPAREPRSERSERD